MAIPYNGCALNTNFSCRRFSGGISFFPRTYTFLESLGGKRMKRMICLCIVVVLLVGLFPVAVQGAELEIPAKSAVLMDAATGTVLYEYNPHEALAPASVTKVMTMLLIMEAIDSGVIAWTDPVTTSETAAAKGGSQIYLKVGETMSVSDMVKSIAVSSANDCACAMAEHLSGSEAAFVDKMNAKAQELGMLDTHFVNCTGLDDGPDAASHKTSALDIAIMSRQLLVNHPDIKQFTTIWMDTVRDGAFGLSNTNKLIRFYPGATGLKTGFTSAAGYCLSASAQKEGMELIAVVMGCESSQDRFNACKTLLDYGFATYAVVNPEVPESAVPVVLGKEAQVRAVAEQEIPLLIQKSQKNQLATSITLEPEVTAPVTKGQRLGTLTVTAGEEVLSQVPLVAAEAVEKLTWWDLFLKILKRICMTE